MRFSEQSQMAVTLGFLVRGRWPNIMQPSHLGDFFYEITFVLSFFFCVLECGESFRMREFIWSSLLT